VTREKVVGELELVDQRAGGGAGIGDGCRSLFVISYLCKVLMPLAS
jgi:hypothetical protein